MVQADGVRPRSYPGLERREERTKRGLVPVWRCAHPSENVQADAPYGMNKSNEIMSAAWGLFRSFRLFCCPTTLFFANAIITRINCRWICRFGESAARAASRRLDSLGTRALPKVEPSSSPRQRPAPYKKNSEHCSELVVNRVGAGEGFEPSTSGL